MSSDLNQKIYVAGHRGIVFLIGALFIAAFNSIKDRTASVANITTLSLILCIFFLYLVGEVATQHGIEILFFRFNFYTVNAKKIYVNVGFL